MLDVGFSELLVFGVIALLVLGPEKLPVAARFVGKWYSKIKRTVSNVQNDIDRELRLSELREQMQLEMQRIQELEQKMQAQMQELQQNKHAEEKQNITANVTAQPQNITYHFIQASVPTVYIAHIWLKILATSNHPIQQIEQQAFTMKHFEVAV
ncbi:MULTISPECIES: Sec-independent protein translocase protein TatB [unclassified Acinetobacter]|uniref:Sec-independent protein translocase protein TatB n=1 Tax=unclassified Acinetobacter TaxID=196816 RepID=UPI002574FA9E|nr:MULTISPECIES: Sec-independent protein translocase protein TatB [unclassified Acinetobacter]MDM1756892.1 twin-arginine translocase subunit TatB [Acinetobacter sp. 256-1]MDM1759919.1 twin-arginine translocase subunit TatB [Acinetobacter sp. 251-1]